MINHDRKPVFALPPALLGFAVVSQFHAASPSGLFSSLLLLVAGCVIFFVVPLALPGSPGFF
jgi:hypothetical protein